MKQGLFQSLVISNRRKFLSLQLLAAFSYTKEKKTVNKIQDFKAIWSQGRNKNHTLENLLQRYQPTNIRPLKD
jgi:hypothetical protein